MIRNKKALLCSKAYCIGGRGQNRTADTRIFNCKNHHLYSVLGPPSLAYARQSVTKLSRL
jgi:hypothetical protein